ncbi:class I SAM-dependent methyltransferase [Patescibacteria group bacterium]|nr:class I SAM-dependent methyltransferase [Patescibacteria group bacterium]
MEHEASWSYAEVWDKFPIPARPCNKELEILEKEIRSLMDRQNNLNILILGSTIEYRSLSKKLGLNPVLVDFSKENFESLSHYSKEKFENETFEQNDWLKISDENKYDVILGHRPFNVIEAKGLGDFFLVMFKALKPGGVFFCRGNTKPGSYISTLEESLAKWAFAENRENPLFSYLEVELYFYCADKDGYVNYEKARNLIDTWYKAEKLNKKDYDLCRLLVSMSDDARFRGLVDELEIKNSYEKVGFKEVEWFRCGHEFGKYMPIIKMIK